MCVRLASCILAHWRVFVRPWCISLRREPVSLNRLRRSRLQPAEKDIIASEWERNATRAYICKVLNISPNTLSKQRQRLKLVPRVRTKTENTHFVGFYVTPEIDRAITIFVRDKGLTKSEWLRGIVNKQLKG